MRKYGGSSVLWVFGCKYVDIQMTRTLDSSFHFLSPPAKDFSFQIHTVYSYMMSSDVKAVSVRMTSVVI